MYPTYFGVHYIFGQRHYVSQAIKYVEIRSWAFMFGSAFGGVHYVEYGHLCSPSTAESVLISHNALPQLHEYYLHQS